MLNHNSASVTPASGRGPKADWHQSTGTLLTNVINVQFNVA